MTLYLFDLDDTLITGYVGNNNPEHDYAHWRLLPGRRETLQRLREERGSALAICTNQPGAAFGYVTPRAVWNKLNAVVEALGFSRGEVGLYACFAHPKAPLERYRDPRELARRKPQPGMLLEAIADYPHAAAGGVLSIGDREEDSKAAWYAGAVYIASHVFFASPSRDSGSDSGALPAVGPMGRR